LEKINQALQTELARWIENNHLTRPNTSGYKLRPFLSYWSALVSYLLQVVLSILQHTDLSINLRVVYWNRSAFGRNDGIFCSTHEVPRTKIPK
jgi:hypothetical protein